MKSLEKRGKIHSPSIFQLLSPFLRSEISKLALTLNPLCSLSGTSSAQSLHLQGTANLSHHRQSQSHNPE